MWAPTSGCSPVGWRASLGPAGTSTLFEPHPHHHEQIRRFARSSHVTYLPLALSDHAGRNDGLVWPHCEASRGPHLVRSRAEDRALIERGLEAGRK